MKTLKFINVILFSVITVVGSVTIINSILSKEFFLTIFNVYPLSIIVGHY
jgi:hypothetical protein